MKPDLVLVKLEKMQIERAKEVNGHRKNISHTLLCGQYGQIFGTEKHCRKYYTVWMKIFSELFERSYESDDHLVKNYESTFDLVNILISNES